MRRRCFEYQRSTMAASACASCQRTSSMVMPRLSKATSMLGRKCSSSVVASGSHIRPALVQSGPWFIAFLSSGRPPSSRLGFHRGPPAVDGHGGDGDVELGADPFSDPLEGEPFGAELTDPEREPASG